jgi:hypothetical protein
MTDATTTTTDNGLAFVRFSLTKEALSKLTTKYGSRENVNTHYIEVLYKDAGLTPPSRETPAERKARLDKEREAAAEARGEAKAAQELADLRAQLEALKASQADTKKDDAPKAETPKADAQKPAQGNTQKPAQGARR